MSRIRLLAFASAIILAALGAGCLDPGPAATAPTNQDPGPGEPAPPPIDVPDADLKALVEGNNQFAIELYKKLAEKHDGNIVISPYSISSALAMTYAGARGETAEQMAKTLHFTLPPERLHPAFGTSAYRLQDGKDNPFQLIVANALWGQRGLPLLPDFLDLTRRNYGGGFREVDFIGDLGDARRIINHWVEEKTQDKIKELLGPNDLRSETRLVLTNAIYLKALWAMPFQTSMTKEAKFEIASGEHVNVPMMQSRSAPFKYYATDNCEWLELPYKGDRLSMILLLPPKGRLADLEKTLTASAIQEGVGKLQFHRGTVKLPRFKATMATRLKKELIDMGMPLAFTPGADFSGMNGRRELRIDNVNHQAYLSVDELGSEAAAATAVLLVSDLFPPFSFSADRPFFFFIRENQTGSILFSGRVVQPN